MVLKPATPGFIVTLAATACLAVVSFSVPYFKSVFFLKATMSQDNFDGSVTFGVMGYCFEVGSQVACSNATIGYEFDPNALFGIDLPLNVEIPSVVIKWITYVLVLHLVGLGAAGIASIFGLLAHIREMSMTMLSTWFSGIGASVTLLAFVFDLIFFFVARSRVRAVGGSAEIGNGLWLTLAAWVMLFLAGCFFGFGRCCIQRRPRGPKGSKGNKDTAGIGHGAAPANGNVGNNYAEAMRLEAIKAEEERKARQKEVGLPAFPTQAEAVPLRKKTEPQYYYEEDSEDDGRAPYRDHQLPGPSGQPRREGSSFSNGARRQASVGSEMTTNYAGRGRTAANTGMPAGYVPAPPGQASVTSYGAGARTPPTFPSSPPLNATTYPPNSNYRQPSAHSTHAYGSASSPPPMPIPAHNTGNGGYLAPGAAAGAYGHSARQSSYHSAVSHQQGHGSTFSQYDTGYGQQGQYGGAPPPMPQPVSGFASGGGNSGYLTDSGAYTTPGSDPYAQTAQQYTNPYDQSQQQQSYSNPYAAQSRTPAPNSNPYSNSYSQPASPIQSNNPYTQYSTPPPMPPASTQPWLNNAPQSYTPPQQYATPSANPYAAPQSPVRGQTPGLGHVNAPWQGGQGVRPSEEAPLPPVPGQGANANIPMESPPGYEGGLNSIAGGGTTATGYPSEKR